MSIFRRIGIWLGLIKPLPWWFGRERVLADLEPSHPLDEIQKAMNAVWDAPAPPGLLIFYDRETSADHMLQAAALGFIAVVIDALQNG